MDGVTRPVGRPSLYDPAYCEQVVAHMAEGASLTSFAAEIDVARDTISEWVNAHPEFSVAVRRGKAKCAAWWEKRGRSIAETGGGPGAGTLVMFGLKNMSPDDWSDATKIDHTSSDGSLKPTVVRIMAAHDRSDDQTPA